MSFFTIFLTVFGDEQEDQKLTASYLRHDEMHTESFELPVPLIRTRNNGSVTLRFKLHSIVFSSLFQTTLIFKKFIYLYNTIILYINTYFWLQILLSEYAVKYPTFQFLKKEQNVVNFLEPIRKNLKPLLKN